MTVRRLSRSNRWATWPAIVTGTGALVLYAATLAPNLTWAHDGADGGDFLAAALTGGVPHPSGYPTYQLLLRAMLLVSPAHPAATGNWLSAFAAAVAVAFCTDLIRRTLSSYPWRSLLATVAGLTWAAAPSLWGQAVITEVYALHALFTSSILWLAWRWGEECERDVRRAWPWLAVSTLLLGLGLGNHLSLIFLLPGLVVWFWSNRDANPGRRREQFRWPLLLLILSAGLAVYTYVPIVAKGSSPVIWGDPATLRGFLWLVSGRLYRSFLFSVDWGYLPGRLAAWVSEAFSQFGGPWGALLAFFGLWRLDQTRHALWRFTGIVVLAFSVYAIGYNTGDSYVYLIPVWMVAAIWLAHGVDRLAAVLVDYCQRYQPQFSGTVATVAVTVVALAVPATSIVRWWGEMNLRHDHAAVDFLDGVLEQADPDAVVLTATDEPTFALWYARYGLKQRSDLTPININLYAYDWYRQRLLAEHRWLSGFATKGDLPLLGEFLAQVAEKRPLYRAEELGLAVTGLKEEAIGPLVKLVPTP